MERKKVPYGISNFEALIKENYYFIDKTKYIEVLENLNEKYLIYLRPRRFGKSLFVSMLEYYYGIEYKDNNLFDELYIGKKPTEKRNSYYILKFNFSGINTNTDEKTRKGFNNNIIESIKNFIFNYELDEYRIKENHEASDILRTFFSYVRKKIKGKIYVLIDEYDHFANEILGFNYEFFKESVAQNGFVRKFYEELKNETGSGLVDRIFITGVTPITLDSLTSGFNIGSNITSDEEFNEMVGFRENEVKELIKTTLENYDIEKNIDKLRAYYNGYKFNEDSKNRIYNSDMILFYVSRYQRKKTEPKDLVDNNVVTDYRKIANLFNIGGMTEERLDVLKSVIKGEEQILNLTRAYNLSGGFSLDDFKSLLYYMGFMTIKRVDLAGRIFMSAPNYVIKELYFEYFEELIEKQTGMGLKTDDIINAIADIALKGKIDNLVKLTEEVLKRLSGRDFIRFDEKYIKIIMLMLLYRSNLYYVKSEYEVEDGFVDILLKKGTIGTPIYYGMIELKYIKKGEYQKRGEEVVNEKLEEGTEQIKRYENTEEVKVIPNLKKWVLVYVGEECKVIKEIS